MAACVRAGTLPSIPVAIWTKSDRELFALAIPTFASLVSEPLLVLADTAFIGHLGAVPLAGLGLGGNVLGVVTGLCVFLAYATTGTTARRFGAGDPRGAFEAGRDGMALGAVLGAVLAALIWALAPTIIGWYHPAPDVAAAAVAYLRLVILGLPFQLVVLASTGLLRGLQDARTPMAVAIGVNLTNIGLDALLIYGFGFGIRGSATATATAQAASCLVLVVRSLGLWISLTATTVVATRMGSLILAAHQVANSIWNFLSFSLDALAIACQALIGRYLGAEDPSGAKRVMRRAMGWGVVQACVVGVVLVVARPLIIRIFTTDPAITHLLLGALVVLACLQPLASLVFVLDGVLIGAGDTRYLAIAGLFVVVIHLPLLALVWHFDAGLVWLWIAYGGFLAARGLTLALRARSGRWASTGE